MDCLFLSNPAAPAAPASIQTALGLVFPCSNSKFRTADYRLPSFNPLCFDPTSLKFKVEALPTVHTLFPKCTPDPGKTRSCGRRILYLIYCSLARACNDVYLRIQSQLPGPAPLAYFNREYLAISLVGILKILRTRFSEQQVSSNMIMKTFLAHPFGREGMDMALPGTSG